MDGEYWPGSALLWILALYIVYELAVCCLANRSCQFASQQLTELAVASVSKLPSLLSLLVFEYTDLV